MGTEKELGLRKSTHDARFEDGFLLVCIARVFRGRSNSDSIRNKIAPKRGRR